jgi:hypothetical protein
MVDMLKLKRKNPLKAFKFYGMVSGELRNSRKVAGSITDCHLILGAYSISDRNQYQESFLRVRRPVRRANNLTAFVCWFSWNLRASTSRNPHGLSRPVMGLDLFMALHLSDFTYYIIIIIIIISVMGLGQLLTRSGLTCPEAPSKVCHDSFCQSGSSVSLPWVIYYEAVCLHVAATYYRGW